MDTSLERIRAKITELETKIGDLRIAERELHALEMPMARNTRAVAAPKEAAPKAEAAAPRAKRGPKPKTGPRGQTIGAAITEVLDKHGAVSAAEIAEHVKAAGRDITNRTVSFALQALKKRGFAKNTNGKWSLPKGRGK